MYIAIHISVHKSRGHAHHGVHPPAGKLEGRLVEIVYSKQWTEPEYVQSRGCGRRWQSRVGGRLAEGRRCRGPPVRGMRAVLC